MCRHLQMSTEDCGTPLSSQGVRKGFLINSESHPDPAIENQSCWMWLPEGAVSRNDICCNAF